MAKGSNSYAKPKSKAARPKAESGGKPVSLSDNESVSLRKISNGYLSTRSSSGKDGSYKSEDTYHPKRPSLSFSEGAKARGKR